jgi:hypothetical protein
MPYALPSEHLPLLLALQITPLPALLPLHAGSISHRGGSASRHHCRELACFRCCCRGFLVMVRCAALQRWLVTGVRVV